MVFKTDNDLPTLTDVVRTKNYFGPTAAGEENILTGLFDEDPEREVERQILRLAEARAQQKAEQILRDRALWLQKAISQEILAKLPLILTERIEDIIDTMRPVFDESTIQSIMQQDQHDPLSMKFPH